MSIYKSSDPPPPALGHFFVPDPPPSLSSCPPPPPPPSSSPTAAFHRAPRPLPLGILRRRRPPGIRRPPTRRCPRPHHVAGPPPSAPGTRSASSPTCPGLRVPPTRPPLPRRPPRPPGLCRRRAACHPAGLRVIASARASTSSTRPAASTFSLTVVLPNTGRGAPLPPAVGVHRPCPTAPVCVSNFINFFWRINICIKLY
jgi:hypothetical protein